MDVSTGASLLGVGIPFTAIGLLKIYGLSQRMIGGGGKPAYQRACGSCPRWSRTVNVAVTSMFLAIGVGYLAYFADLLLCP